MDGQWICVNINYNCITDSNNITGIVKKELKDIFGTDLRDVLVIDAAPNSDTEESLADSYVFVRCENYADHAVNLQESKFIVGVLNDYCNPHFISDLEVNGFRNTVENSKDKELFVGDIVVINSGYLKNLYGIVIETLDYARYEVIFKLYTRCFIKILRRKNLIHNGNIIDRIKVPRDIRKTINNKGSLE